MRRFLFIFSDTGGGHRSAVQAVKAALEFQHGAGAEVLLCDVLRELGSWPFDRLPQWYPALVSFRGIPWGMAYQLSNYPLLVKLLSLFFWPYVGPPLVAMLRRYAPDVLVSFHPLPNGVLQRARRALTPAVVSATVILDLATVHAGWFAPGFELYVTPTAAVRERALRWGTPPERVVVVGMPVQQRFSAAAVLSPEQARAQLGLRQERPVVLLVGGGEGMGRLAAVVSAVARACPQAQLVAVAGRNRALQAQLAALRVSSPLITPGFVPNMELWMRAADVLVTKAGPNTLAEAFSMGLPVVLYTALPGQETGNVAYVVAHGAGVWAPGPAQAARAVVQLLAEPQPRDQLAARARALDEPGAAARIAQRLWTLGQSGIM